LTAILRKLESPLSKANLQLIGRAFLKHLPQDCRTALAKRHKSDGDQFAKGAAQGDELTLSRLLVEMSLVGPAKDAYSKDGGALIESVAKRLRISVEKIAKDVVAESAARRSKRAEGTKARERTKKPSAA
jgi:hypothetical protein